MTNAATFQRSVPLRTRLSLVALAWVSTLGLVLAPDDSMQSRWASNAQTKAASPASVVSAPTAPAADIDPEPARPAVSVPIAEPVPLASAPPTPSVSAERTPDVAETAVSVITERTSESQSVQLAVTASLPAGPVGGTQPSALERSGPAPVIPTPAAAVPAALVISAPSPNPAALSAREQRLFDAMNAQRALLGVPPLLANAALTQAARSRSQDMVSNGYFAHFGPKGQSWYTALAAVGWTMSGGGENLAKVAGDERTSVSDAIEGLMASPTHRANIVSQSFRLVGVGAVVDAAGITVFTTIFTDR